MRSERFQFNRIKSHRERIGGFKSYGQGVRTIICGGNEVAFFEDAAKIMDQATFTDLGIVIKEHREFPDAVLYDEKYDWTFLIEAGISHGPAASKRDIELQPMRV